MLISSTIWPFSQIEYLSDGAFFNLSSIEELSLDRNRVKEVAKGWLYGLRTLTTLGLSHNQVCSTVFWFKLRTVVVFNREARF